MITAIIIAKSFCHYGGMALCQNDITLKGYGVIYGSPEVRAIRIGLLP